jgi:DNA-binding transcriptional regulator YiaG
MFARKLHAIESPAEQAEPEAPAEPVNLHETLAKSVRAAAKARAATKPAPKAKPAPKPKAQVQRVPAPEVLKALKRLGMSQSSFARAAGVSPSLVCEWVGKGRGMLAVRERWTAALAAAEKAPKAATK